MNSNYSQETLRRIERNDVSCQGLTIGYSGFEGGFKSSDASDYSRLGAAIGDNTYLEELRMYFSANQALDTANTEFFDGLKSNSSISDLQLHFYHHNLVGGIGHEILKSYQDNNNNLIMQLKSYSRLITI